MRAAHLLALATAAVALAAPAAAHAHPLGNFSINHLTEVRVAPDRVDVRYVLDQAEIPTFQERGLSDDAVLARKRAEVLKRLVVTVGGRRVALAPGAARLSHPAGQGGLKTMRLELPLSARVKTLGAVRVHDGTFPGRIGWKAVVPLPGRGTAVKSDVPGADPTGALRHYPRDLLKSPEDIRDASLTVATGSGTVAAPDGRTGFETGEGSEGFAGLLEKDGGVLLLLLAAAFGWGALHALSPGHGKSMVAAYLVGTRGSVRDAVALGATVTVAHTAGVIALGLVALLLSAWILPEDLYPWLNLVAGLLVVGVGIRVLRMRLRGAPEGHSHGHGHHHHHHDHAHDHALTHTHDHAPRSDRRSILALGASAGLIPCPTALVVLLGAISQHRVGLGLVLIVAFSAGLAATLTGLGIAVVHASKALARFSGAGRLAGSASAVSAALIVIVGAALTLQAVPQLPV
jgi:ABC-type nickel/cobalt efflux system permease component RcnA